mmetsp:Transcript_77161/g.236091  ORF Transcript_77161/g.236091 Transcript_77161/m.236091 type:complete len:346 (-) Transcript_77161:366-1403(-)
MLVGRALPDKLGHRLQDLLVPSAHRRVDNVALVLQPILVGELAPQVRPHLRAERRHVGGRPAVLSVDRRRAPEKRGSLFCGAEALRFGDPMPIEEHAPLLVGQLPAWSEDGQVGQASGHRFGTPLGPPQKARLGHPARAAARVGGPVRGPAADVCGVHLGVQVEAGGERRALAVPIRVPGEVQKEERLQVAQRADEHVGDREPCVEPEHLFALVLRHLEGLREVENSVVEAQIALVHAQVLRLLGPEVPVEEPAVRGGVREVALQLLQEPVLLLFRPELAQDLLGVCRQLRHELVVCCKKRLRHRDHLGHPEVADVGRGLPDPLDLHAQVAPVRAELAAAAVPAL